MTQEQYEKANEISEQIDSMCSVLNDLNKALVINVVFESFSHSNQRKPHRTVFQDDGLNNVIAIYFQNRISALEKEFEKL